MARDSGLKIACFNNLGAAVSLNTIAPEWVRQVTKPVQTGFTAQCGATSKLRVYRRKVSFTGCRFSPTASALGEAHVAPGCARERSAQECKTRATRRAFCVGVWALDGLDVVVRVALRTLLAIGPGGAFVEAQSVNLGAGHIRAGQVGRVERRATEVGVGQAGR